MAVRRDRIAIKDEVSLAISPGLRTAYMVRSEFENELKSMTCKVFASESAAKTYAGGQEIIAVDIVRKF